MENMIRKLIRNIPDFPKEGIQFKDITPVLANAQALEKMIDWFAITIEAAGEVEKIVGVESRGFIIGSAVARKMGLGFVPIRKPGKLPYQTYREEYDLEYGKDALEIHIDALQQNENVALVDDLLATGGTAAAAAQLLTKAGANVISTSFLVELDFLNGREKLKQAGSLASMIHF